MWNPTARLFKFVHLLLAPTDSNRRRDWQTLRYLDGFIGRLWSNTGRMRPNSARSSRCSASLSSCSPSCATWACWRGSLSPPTSPLYSPFSSHFGSLPRYAKSFGISRPCPVDVALVQVPPQNPSDVLENPGREVDHTTQSAAPYDLPSGRLLLSSAENHEARLSRAHPLWVSVNRRAVQKNFFFLKTRYHPLKSWGWLKKHHRKKFGSIPPTSATEIEFLFFL